MVTKGKTKDQQLIKDIRAELARLGGQMMQEDSVLFEGDKFVIPSRYSADAQPAINFLSEWWQSKLSMKSYVRTFKYRPWDGAKVTWDAFNSNFGLATLKGVKHEGIFGSSFTPPKMISIPGPDGGTIEIPWGNVKVPILPHAELYFDQAHDEDLGPIFQVSIEAREADESIVLGLFKMIEEELKANSIYKGKAIDGATMPHFLDLSKVDPDQVVYDLETMQQLDTHIWSPLRDTDLLRRSGLALKRSILLAGKYGTGKTLAAYLTGKKAEENGWTFIFVRPGEDDLGLCYKTAYMYAPAMVFFEDCDREGNSDSGEVQISQLLDMFDGLGAKGSEIMGVFTTNHPESIHKGMARPGRLDAFIELGPLDLAGVKRMIEVTVPESNREELNYEQITAAVEGYMPAFVKEAIDRTLRYAIARSGELDAVLTTADFVGAAHGLRPQHELMEGLRDKAEKDPLAVLHSKIATKAVLEVAEDKGW